MNGWTQAICIGAGAVLIMFVLWLIQLRTRNAGVVDAGWAGSLGAAAIFAAATGAGDPERRWLIGVMGGLWGLRLAAHLLKDRIIGEPEEGRYQKLREDWKDNANRNLLIFFEMQALLVVVLSAPFILASAPGPTGLAAAAIGGAALFLIGLVGESIADRQLHRFKRDPANKGRVCNVGLWRYSRHPNYFFEWLIWCAFALVALPSPWGWTALSAPALMLFFILKVTGIPPTEARALLSRGDAYREYQRTTSVFVPWFPKRQRGARA